MEKVIKFINEHKEFCTITGLLILFYFIFFHNIGNYALMDTDETRYVSMARDMFNTKDFMTLYLNGEYFFEKPPLYFWGECLFFGLFGKVNEFSARFPVALYGTLTSFLIYFTGRKIVSRKFGVLSALILATSLEFIILAKFAILDIVVATMIAFSICFGFLTFFVEERNKKYFWWLFYIFSALAVMAKGIPGFVVPFGTMFFASIAAKKFKEIFRPVFILPGILLFLLIVLPWHILMFNIHNPLFYNEYIIKHHIDRFFNSAQVGREQPFWFYFVTMLWGLFPWIGSFLSALFVKIKSIKIYMFEALDNEQKLVYLNGIALLFTLLFFSASSTKLITYILPAYIPAAFIGGYIWNHYDKKYNISVYILGGILIIASIAAIFTKWYLPEQLYIDILNAKWLCISLLGISGILSIIFAKKENSKGIFAVYVGFMLLLSAFGTKEFFNIDYKFGQNDLMEFAKYTKEHNYELGGIGMSRKYSLVYYHGGKVNYINDFDEFKKINSNEMIVVRSKNLNQVQIPYEIIKTGRRYTLIK